MKERTITEVRRISTWQRNGKDGRRRLWGWMAECEEAEREVQGDDIGCERQGGDLNRGQWMVYQLKLTIRKRPVERPNVLEKGGVEEKRRTSAEARVTSRGAAEYSETGDRSSHPEGGGFQ